MGASEPLSEPRVDSCQLALTLTRVELFRGTQAEMQVMIRQLWQGMLTEEGVREAARAAQMQGVGLPA